MTYKILWTPKGKEDLFYWKKKNINIINKISVLVHNIKVDPCSGIGKPERLKYKEQNIWSRRITKEHRLVYYINETIKTVYIVQCRHHYYK